MRDVARLRYALAREVERLVEAVAAAAVQRFESHEILRAAARGAYIAARPVA